MKYIILISFIFLQSLASKGQSNNGISLTTNGEGPTPEQAVQNALRSAIEQSFGVFISARTEILNDDLIKDELVTISNGNIQKYEILSQVYFNERKVYFVTVESVVSLENLASFIQQKGFDNISFNGAAFGHNIKLMKLNEISEKKAISNLIQLGLSNIKSMVNYELIVSDPTYLTGTDELFIPLTISISANENWNIYYNNFISSLNSISLAKHELETFESINRPIHRFYILNDQGLDNIYYFRSEETLRMIDVFFKILNIEALQKFQIESELGSIFVPRRYDDLFQFNIYELMDIGYSDVQTNQWLKRGSQPWLFATSYDFNVYADYYNFNQERVSAASQASGHISNKLKLDYNISRLIAFMSGSSRLNANNPLVLNYNEFLSEMKTLSPLEKIEKSLLFFPKVEKNEVDNYGNRIITGFTYLNRSRNSVYMTLNYKLREDDLSKLTQFSLTFVD